jgi:hypothetical protein
MGFLGKVKELFSDGGVEINGQLNPPASLSSGTVAGTITVIGEKPDTLKNVVVSLEKRTVKQPVPTQPAEHETEHIGETTIPAPNPNAFGPNQPITLPFQIDFTNWLGTSKHLVTATEKLEQEGGALGSVVKGLNKMGGVSYHYYLNVVCEVGSRSFSVSKEIEVAVSA